MTQVTQISGLATASSSSILNVEVIIVDLAGLDSLRPEIALSWRRSAASGLSPGMSPDRLTIADIDRRSRLLVAATPVLDDIGEQLEGTGSCVVLADREQRLVDRRYDARAVELALDHAGVVPGSQFTEETTGTNSIATPYEVRKGVTVTGSEHYLEALKPYSCYGHPIQHPVTRRVEGVLDITGRAEDANPLWAPFISHAVEHIEQRLLDGSRLAEQQLFAAFQSAQHRNCAVLVLGDDVLLANTAAMDLVTAADHPMLRELALDSLSLGHGGRTLQLPSGANVEVRVERVGGTGGALFELNRAEGVRSKIPRGQPRPGSLYRSIERTLRNHGSRRERVMIVGEPGTGRTTAAALLGEGSRLAVVDAADLPGMGQRAWCARLEELAATHEGLIVVESVHLLSERVVAWLCRLLDTSSAWIALTAQESSTPDEVEAPLRARFAASISLPPLRERRDELPSLAQAVIDRHLSGRSLRLTPSALEVLYQRPWPGNLRELESVLRQAAGDGRVGDITARELPAGCGSTRRLTALEQAEYDAITRALQAAGGNKVHAANHLGISRSTLYLRIRALGITV